jgi:hypothetical protein
MALNKPFETFERPGLVVSYKLAASKVYKGSNLAVNATGFAVPITHTGTGYKYLGVSNETLDNSGGAAGDKSVNVTKSGTFVFKAAAGYTPTQADIGKEVYAVTDWEVQVATAGLTNQYKVGTIVAIEPTSSGQTGVRVRVGNYTL